MPAIRLLPEVLVNRIAAGEVVERPAAAVKELVENALDAGSRRIAVDLQGGGITRIEVVDDGCGIPAADLALAVQRHATSKLGDDGLVRITTLGFRGEALPSIGAVARLHLTSRPPGAETAYAIQVDGGRVGSPAPAAGAPGTRAVVSDLFWATPARAKFLKPARTEAEYAEAAVRRLALSAPSVAFRCVSDGRTVFDRPAEDRAARVAALLGPDAQGALLPVDGERDGLLLSGYVCQPSVTRATAVGMHLVVNGRPVADPVLRIALRVAARDVMAPGRHPVAALFLDLPAAEVDVNVHPAKSELRFRDQAAVRALVIGTVSRVLAGGASQAAPQPLMSLGRGNERPGLRLTYPSPAPHPHGLAEAALPLVAPPAARPAQPIMGPRPTAAAPPVEYPLGAAVAQVLDTYVLAVSSDGSLVLIDQHAAAERLAHEALRAQHLSGGVRAQALLQPAVVDLPPHDTARLLDAAEELTQLGLEIEGFGPGALLVRAMPAALGGADPAALLRDLADDLAESGDAASLHARLDAVLARLACHGSLRAGRRLTLPEMDSLLRRMEATPRAATCSHGRPTYLKLTKPELERMFGRR